MGEGEEEWLSWMNPERDLRIVKGGEDEDEEIEEVIGFLGMIISQIQYLAPWMPIPHSEYLFTHYVSRLYFLISILKNNK